MRGEYATNHGSNRAHKELPPRARRIQAAAQHDAVRAGTTSACAENTFTPSGKPDSSWNYLRVRGEYLKAALGAQQFKELPPRARRILSLAFPDYKGPGTTSACAENTNHQGGDCLMRGNYLRVRGEY